MTETMDATNLERRRADLERYLRELASCIGLSDWAINVSPEPARDDDEDAYTYITVVVDVGRRATVRAHERFWACSREERRHLATHELCHLPAERFGEVLAMVKPLVSARVLAAVKTSFDTAEEHMVEWAAQQIAPNLPLPPTFGGEG